MMDKTKIPVFDYELTTHMGICIGPVDALFGIYVNDKLAWPPAQTSGDDTVARCPDGVDYVKLNLGLPVEECISPTHAEIMTTQRDVYVNEPDLFGGDQRSGGVRGMVSWLPGRLDQILPAHIAFRMKDVDGVRYEDTGKCPAYRGIASLFFTGGRKPEPVRRTDGLVLKNVLAEVKAIASKAKGFVWKTNEYTMPPSSARPFNRMDAPPLSAWFAENRNKPGFPAAEGGVLVIQTPKSEARPKPDSGGEMLVQGGGFPTVNPAALIYAMIASRIFDVNAGEDMMDADSFITCARILSKEKLGISFIWNDQATVKEIAGQVLNHVGGAVFIHPVTGLYTMRLLRADADFDALFGDVARPELTGFVVNSSNAEIDGDVERKGWSDVTSSVDVKFTEDETQEEQIITLHDRNAIAAAGGDIKHDELDFLMFRNREAAKTAGLRSLGASSRPFIAASFILNRQGWSMAPFDVVTVNYPSERIENMRFRVMKVNYGSSTDRKIRIECVQDIFSERMDHVADASQPPLWSPESSKPVIDATYITPLSAQLCHMQGYADSNIERLEEADEQVNGHLISSRQPMLSANAFTRIGNQQFTDQSSLIRARPSARMPVRLKPEAQSTLNFYELDFGPQEDDVDVGDLLFFVRGNKTSYEPAWPVRPASASEIPYHYTVLQLINDPSQTPVGTSVGTAAVSVDETLDPDFAYPLADRMYRDEVAMVTAINRTTGDVTLMRGIYDTVPAPIAIGTRVFHSKGTPPTPSRPAMPVGTLNRTVYEPSSLSGTSSDYSASISHNNYPRLSLPTRVANTTLTTSAGQVPFGKNTVLDAPEDVVVSWANRDKMLEDLQPLAWDDENVVPHEDQKAYIRVFRRVQHGGAFLVFLGAYYDLPGKSFTIPASVFQNSMSNNDWNMGTNSNPNATPIRNLVSSDIENGARFVIEIGAQQVTEPGTEFAAAGNAEMSCQRAVMLLDIGTAPGGYGLAYGRDYGGTT